MDEIVVLFLFLFFFAWANLNFFAHFDINISQPKHIIIKKETLMNVLIYSGMIYIALL